MQIVYRLISPYFWPEEDWRLHFWDFYPEHFLQSAVLLHSFAVHIVFLLWNIRQKKYLTADNKRTPAVSPHTEADIESVFC